MKEPKPQNKKIEKNPPCNVSANNLWNFCIKLPHHFIAIMMSKLNDLREAKKTLIN